MGNGGKKILKEQLVMLGIVVLLICTGLSGCVEIPVSGKAPANINQFMSVREGELIRFYFFLEDKDGVNTVSDGSVKLQIFDELNSSIYYRVFNVKASEFVDYQMKLTGASIGKAYEWRIPIDDIEKGISIIGFGRGVLTFTTPQGKSLSAENVGIEIRSYTEEEIKNMYEAEYENSSIMVNEKISKGNFEITLVKLGYYNLYVFDLNQYLRIDMEVKNIGSESDFFTPNGLAIIDSQNNQYEVEIFGGTLDIFTTIYPDITKKGYLLFEDVPKTETSLRLLFELGYDEQFNPYLFEYNINLL